MRTRREEYNIHEQRRAEPLTPYMLQRSMRRYLSRLGSRLPPGLPFGFFLVFSCWARLTGQRAWIKYEGHPFDPFLRNNLNQREDGRRKQQRYSERSGCGRGSHRPSEGHAPLTLWAKCFRDAETWEKNKCPPTTYRGHRNTAQEWSQPMSETNRIRSQQERESRLHTGTPGGKQTGGRPGLHCDHGTGPPRHLTDVTPARPERPGRGRCLDPLVCAQKGSHPGLC